MQKRRKIKEMNDNPNGGMPLPTYKGDAITHHNDDHDRENRITIKH